VVAGLILLLTVALVIGIVWVSNVDPLGPGSGTFAIRDPRVHATSHLVDAFGVFGLVQTVSVEPGATFDYQISVRNDGAVPVTVLNVGEAGGQISRRAVAMNLYPYVNPHAAPDRYVPFAPFRLGSGQEARIELEVNVSDEACVQPDVINAWSQELMTYSIFGITRHSLVDTRTEIRVEGKNKTVTGC
jgi:hypothetical protein